MPRLFSTLLLALIASATQAESGREDYDLDNDGLIEINDLADLDEIRNNLDGTSLYGSSNGCPADGCTGFELTTDLNFDTNGDGVMDERDDYWNDGAGWEAIGDSRNAFSAEFHGKGHLIRNLYIDRSRSNYQGLFGYTESAQITTVGLSGPLIEITGEDFVGGVVGYARDTQVEGVFSNGTVRAEDSTHYSMGGLVGYVRNGYVRASFFTGKLQGEGDEIGGLVGYNNSGEISSSFSVGRMGRATFDIGGLVGTSQEGTVVDSYWATDRSGQRSGAGGVGALLSELQCPTEANDSDCLEGLYTNWDQVTDSDGSAYWEFGDESELPALRLGDRVYRDSDLDGVVDSEDDFPKKEAAWWDSDGDGYIDFWAPDCDSACRDASGLALDQFPDNAAAAVDTDLDGLPEEWNSDCDESCQGKSGLALDAYPGDADNDGVPDSDHPRSNGLIKVSSLAELDAMRYSLDGGGRRMASGDQLDTAGCPTVVHQGVLQRRCHGYELTQDLDFDTNGDGVMDERDDYWNNGAGWESIGGWRSEFRAVLEGNGHLIRNLYIDRSGARYQGLFGLTENARVQNLGLTGPLMSVTGNYFVGALAGYSTASTIEGVFSTGPVQGDSYSVGGLIGLVTGEGQLRAAFSTGSVTSQSYEVGGLVGELHSGEVQSSYATGRVEGESDVGGLVGKQGASSLVANSYWSTDLSGQTESAGGVGALLSELQCPVSTDNDACAVTTLYEQWGEIEDSEGNAYWDFGTDEQLPTLVLSGKTYQDSDGDGVLDGDDVWPFNPVASMDADGDGHPDAWGVSCDGACREASGLVLDQFPDNPAAALDTDLDGMPEEWNGDCDSFCRDNSGLTLDMHPGDADNDGVADSEHPHANGLINIDNLKQLHAIRYSMAGVGRRKSAEDELDTTGCPAVLHQGTLQRRCHGYELTQDLDFDTNGDGVLDKRDDYWNEGRGWWYIGRWNNPFQTVFEGNGHVIRNLYIDRPDVDMQSLFGRTENARIQNIGLTGSLMSVSGNGDVGALVGYADATTIEGVFSTGPVQGDVSNVGGLVGYLDGASQLKAAFSTGSVTGGLNNVGGLVGYLRSGDVQSSYATGRVQGKNRTGGLIGNRLSSVPVETSYWATDLSGQSNSDGGVGAELTELQCPEESDNDTCAESTLYERWDESQDSEGNAYWDFGVGDQLPALVLAGKLYRDSDGDGALDQDDAFPASSAASVDTDGDGYPDSWHVTCDAECRDASGLVLDQFPDNAAAAIDGDLDGLPDEWNRDCDQSCQDDAGLTLDAHPSDADNDGVADSEHPHANGLININNLAELDVIRHSMEGVGRRMSDEDELDTSGCPVVVREGTLERRCHGYELSKDLNFDTNGDGVLDEQDEYWNDGAGWESIGDSDNPFQTVFEGNGHVIRNLYIDRPSTGLQGLFGHTKNARIQNIGLTGALMNVSGDWSVGALVGSSYATTIKGVFSTGPVQGDGSNVGGLVGYVSGESQLRAVFSTGSVTGDSGSDHLGGLVGYLYSGEVQVSYATGRVESTSGVDEGGLVGSNYYGAMPVTASHWATDLSGQSESKGGVGAQLSELQCPEDSDSDTCAQSTLYEEWSESQDSEGNAYWNFGTDEQLPALALKGKTYRDSDGDGVLDEEDAFPDKPAASVDEDEDGLPDAWHESCDADCQEESGLTLDEHPNDTDNDGVDNEVDAFPANAAASEDADEDGLPDEWHESCDPNCQDNSGLTLDGHLNDTDNDGVVNEEDHYPTDPDRWQDDVPPEMVLVPEPMHMASTGELTEVTLKVEDAGGYDSFSESVSFRVYHDEERLAWDDEYRVELPVGKVILNWVAVDNAGNESAPMPQTVNVYPQVSFTESESITGEGNAARVSVSLSGPSPVYPVTLTARWVEADSTATAEDVRTEGEGAVDLNELTAVIESEEALAEAGFVVPIVQDDQSEMDEQLVLTLQAAHAGEATEESTEEAEAGESRFEMPLLEQGTGHTLTITEANLAPTLSLSLEQDGESVNVVRRDGGEVTVEATITDANGDDEHQLEWYTGDLPFVVDNTEHRFTFDPMDLDTGEYTISALVSDNGDPALSSEEITLGWNVEAADSDEESDETEETEDEGTGEGETDNGADNEETGNEETGNVGSDAGSNGGSGGGGGSVHIGALLLLLMLALARTGLARRRPDCDNV